MSCRIQSLTGAPIGPSSGWVRHSRVLPLSGGHLEPCRRIGWRQGLNVSRRGGFPPAVAAGGFHR